jgi:hypothetical protein
LIIISEQRVGSRWALGLLADLYGKQVSPEYTRQQHLGETREKTLKDVQKKLERNIIVKFHHTTPGEIFGTFAPVDYKVIGIVRNPRDRGVSVAFHHMYDHDVDDWPQKNMTEREAIRFTVLDYPHYAASNARQFDLMLPGYSTKTWRPHNYLPYIWTCYEWLKSDAYKEMESIVGFIDMEPEKPLAATVEEHSFSRRAGRKPGEEKRDDVRRRKGIVGDWQNWFDGDMLEATQHAHDQYLVRLQCEERLSEILPMQQTKPDDD